MAELHALCVYCAASNRVDPCHLQAAYDLGRLAARRGIRIVFGAGSVGLMGALAEGALSERGEITGIIPEHIEKWELGHKGISEYLVVSSMHERKRLMFERSDAFCVLPGGLGTLDETLEMITWRQLKMHDKPIVLVNNAGYWDPLLRLIEHIIAEGFLHQVPERLFQVVQSVPEVFDAIAAAPPPALPDLVERL